jgi:hypothetical protein
MPLVMLLTFLKFLRKTEVHMPGSTFLGGVTYDDKENGKQT